MSKFILRIVALLTIPCLITDSIHADHWTSQSNIVINKNIRFRPTCFQTEALTLALGYPINPIVNRAKLAWTMQKPIGSPTKPSEIGPALANHPLRRIGDRLTGIADKLSFGKQAAAPLFTEAFPRFADEVGFVQRLIRGEDVQTVLREARTFYGSQHLVPNIDRIIFEEMTQPFIDPATQLPIRAGAFVDGKTLVVVLSPIGKPEERRARGISAFHEIYEHLILPFDPSISESQRSDEVLHTVTTLAEIGFSDELETERDHWQIGQMLIGPLEDQTILTLFAFDEQYEDTKRSILKKFPEGSATPDALRTDHRRALALAKAETLHGNLHRIVEGFRKEWGDKPPAKSDPKSPVIPINQAEVNRKIGEFLEVMTSPEVQEELFTAMIRKDLDEMMDEWDDEDGPPEREVPWTPISVEDPLGVDQDDFAAARILNNTAQIGGRENVRPLIQVLLIYADRLVKLHNAAPNGGYNKDFNLLYNRPRFLMRNIAEALGAVLGRLSERSQLRTLGMMAMHAVYFSLLKIEATDVAENIVEALIPLADLRSKAVFVSAFGHGHTGLHLDGEHGLQELHPRMEGRAKKELALEVLTIFLRRGTMSHSEWDHVRRMLDQFYEEGYYTQAVYERALAAFRPENKWPEWRIADVKVTSYGLIREAPSNIKGLALTSPTQPPYPIPQDLTIESYWEDTVPNQRDVLGFIPRRVREQNKKVELIQLYADQTPFRAVDPEDPRWYDVELYGIGTVGGDVFYRTAWGEVLSIETIKFQDGGRDFERWEKAKKEEAMADPLWSQQKKIWSEIRKHYKLPALIESWRNGKPRVNPFLAKRIATDYQLTVAELERLIYLGVVIELKETELIKLFVMQPESKVVASGFFHDRAEEVRKRLKDKTTVIASPATNEVALQVAPDAAKRFGLQDPFMKELKMTAFDIFDMLGYLETICPVIPPEYGSKVMQATIGFSLQLLDAIREGELLLTIRRHDASTYQYDDKHPEPFKSGEALSLSLPPNQTFTPPASAPRGGHPKAGRTSAVRNVRSASHRRRSRTNHSLATAA